MSALSALARKEIALHSTVPSLKDYINLNNSDTFEKEVDAFLSKGLDINLRGEHCETLLHIAARLNNARVVELLIKKDIAHTVDDHHHYYPWHTAALFGSTEVMNCFIQHVNVHESVDSTGLTVLHLAAMTGHTELVQVLLDSGADVNCVDSLGATPLLRAIFFRHEDTAEVLLESGVDLTFITKLDITPCGAAAFFLSRLCLNIFDKVKHPDRDASSEVKLTYYQSYITRTDLKIIHLTISNECTVESSRHTITHPLVQDLITIVDDTAYRWFFAVFIWVVGFLAYISYLCMLSESNLLVIDLEQDLVKFVLIVMGLVLIVADYCIYQFLNWGLVLTKMKVCDKRIIERLAGIFHHKHHPGLLKKETCFEKFIKQIQHVEQCQTQGLILRWVHHTVLRAVVFTSMFLDYQVKHIVLSAAMIVTWLQVTFNVILYMPWAPTVFVVTAISLKSCILAVLQMLGVLFFCCIPFSLVIIKLSILEGACFDDKIVCDKGWESGWNITYSSFYHLWKVMMVDEYHSDYFEGRHDTLLTVFYITTTFFSSIVVINMSIAKLSIMYEEVTQNANYEILKGRLGTIVVWERFPATAFYCNKEEIETNGV